MRKAWWLVVLGLGVAAACSLNPQPYPPDTNDGGKGGFDATTSDVANGLGDSGSVEDAAEETSPPPGSDAGGDAATDAGDAETDAATDAASDAESDAATDAPND